MDVNTVDLDANTAAAIAAGMRKVAKADGDSLHPNELILIESFEKEIQSEGGGGDSAVAIWDAAIREVYLKSLLMVALADGRISKVERAVIDDLAMGVGADAQDVTRAMQSVKAEFMSVFEGVTHFKEQVQQVADDLESDLSS